jgi:hypothetical protein
VKHGVEPQGGDTHAMRGLDEHAGPILPPLARLGILFLCCAGTRPPKIIPLRGWLTHYNVNDEDHHANRVTETPLSSSRLRRLR